MDALKREFKISNFGLVHNNVHCFIACQWRWRPWVYSTYRLVLALYVTGFVIFTVTELLRTGVYNFMAFLTIWTYLMLDLYLISAAIVTLCNRRRCSMTSRPENANFAKPDVSIVDDNGAPNSAFSEISDDANNSGHWVQSSSDVSTYGTSLQIMIAQQPDITISMKITWVLGNVVQCFVLIVTVVYFTALFPLIGRTNFFDINIHGLTTLFMIIDTCLTARPVRLLHAIHPAIYGLCYLIFSLIYWGVDHNNVLYPGVLDWNYPGTTLIWVCGLTFVALPLLQLAYFGAFRLRLIVYRRIYGVDFMQL